jgi:hypothetical protein
MRRNVLRALAIMPCTIPVNDVWTPPGAGCGHGLILLRLPLRMERLVLQ